MSSRTREKDENAVWAFTRDQGTIIATIVLFFAGGAWWSSNIIHAINLRASLNEQRLEKIEKLVESRTASIDSIVVLRTEMKAAQVKLDDITGRLNKVEPSDVLEAVRQLEKKLQGVHVSSTGTEEE